MTLPEILGLIGVILSVAILVILVFILNSKVANDDGNLKDIEESIIEKVRNLETAVTKSIYESMLRFNNDVNEQLRKQTETSNENITEFRLNVNKELTGFQTKINEDLSKDFKSLNESIEKRMSEINEKVEERLSKGFVETNKTFVQIAERVKVIDDAQKKIESLSEEMIGLQNILSNNQARGAFGEYQLNQLLLSVFGENDRLYQTQYTILKDKNETYRADAVIFMPKPNGMVAIDSKFPYSSYSKLFDNNELTKEENDRLISDFGREVKKHITDIANKYIVTGITSDYAIMFVPSDGILALLHSKLVTIIEYARNKNITIVSPTTLIPLLSSFQAVAIDFERSKHTKEIIEQLKKLKINFRIFGDEWSKLNRSIDTLRKDGDKVNNRVEKLNTRFHDIDKVNFLEEPKVEKLNESAEDTQE